MKTLSKRRVGRTLLSYFMLVALALPMTAGAALPADREERQTDRAERIAERAENRETMKEEAKDRREGLFCNTVVESAGRIATTLSERKTKLEARREGRAGTIDENRDNRDGKLADTRSDADEHRNALYATLERNADSDAKKAAVAAFKKTVETAIDTRRDALDVAIKTFRTGVDTAIAGRKDDMESAANRFTTAVNAAVDQAKQSCAEGTAPESVRTTFRSALKAARQSLQEDQKTAEKLKAKIQVLADARKAAFTKAISDFKTTLEAAKADMKKAFGDDADL